MKKCKEKLQFLLICRPDRCDTEEIVLARNVRSKQHLTGQQCEHGGPEKQKSEQKTSSKTQGVNWKTALCVYSMSSIP